MNFDPENEFLKSERERTQREVLQPVWASVKRHGLLRRGFRLHAGGELKKGNTLNIPKDGVPTINNRSYVHPVELRKKIAIFIFTEQFVYKILPSLITTVAKADRDTGKIIFSQDLISDITLSVGEPSTMTLKSSNWGENIGTPGLYTPGNLKQAIEDIIPTQIFVISNRVVQIDRSIDTFEWDNGNIPLDFFQNPGI